MDFVLNRKDGSDENEIAKRIQQLQEFNQIFADQEQTTKEFYSSMPHDTKLGFAGNDFKPKMDRIELLENKSEHSVGQGSFDSDDEVRAYTY